MRQQKKSPFSPSFRCLTVYKMQKSTHLFAFLSKKDGLLVTLVFFLKMFNSPLFCRTPTNTLKHYSNGTTTAEIYIFL